MADEKIAELKATVRGIVFNEVSGCFEVASVPRWTTMTMVELQRAMPALLAATERAPADVGDYGELIALDTLRKAHAKHCELSEIYNTKLARHRSEGVFPPKVHDEWQAFSLAAQAENDAVKVLLTTKPEAAIAIASLQLERDKLDQEVQDVMGHSGRELTRLQRALAAMTVERDDLGAANAIQSACIEVLSGKIVAKQAECEALRALMAKATPVPWTLEGQARGRWIGGVSTNPAISSPDVVATPSMSDRVGFEDDNNMSLIVAAINALPMLLDAAERAPADVDWGDIRGCAPDATGELSSEAFVRELRDEWPDHAAAVKSGPQHRAASQSDISARIKALKKETAAMAASLASLPPLKPHSED